MTAAGAAALPAEAGTERQLVWLYTPAEDRGDVAALLSLEAEIAAGARPGTEHAVAHLRLGWWLEETEALAAGRPRHPLGVQLATAFMQRGLSPPDLRGLAGIARLDLACTAFESAPEYAQYLLDWSLAAFRTLALRLLPDPAARAALERFCRAAGSAVRDVELVARLASDARLGRIHVAMQVGAAPAEAAYEPWQRQPWPAHAAGDLRDRLRARRAALAEACRSLPAEWRPALRPMLVWCALAARLADRCLRALPLQYDPGRRDALAAAWTAWRSAVAADRGHPPPLLLEEP